MTASAHDDPVGAVVRWLQLEAARIRQDHAVDGGVPDYPRGRADALAEAAEIVAGEFGRGGPSHVEPFIFPSSTSRVSWRDSTYSVEPSGRVRRCIGCGQPYGSPHSRGCEREPREAT